jgi:3-isopropylmalate/(R)-2-methylmalate dehydratase small subunit
MKPFTTVSGVAAPLLEDDINTDQIAPAAGHNLNPDYAAMLFASRREGKADDEGAFVLDRPQFRSAHLLVSGDNFGCGSSRETAVWSMAAFGIRCIIARSFADTYRDNCVKNGVLPVVLAKEDAAEFEALVVDNDGRDAFTADLEAQTITAPGGRVFAFEIPADERALLLEGLDNIGLTQRHEKDIAAWEARTRREQPWLQTLRQSASEKID